MKHKYSTYALLLFLFIGIIAIVFGDFEDKNGWSTNDLKTVVNPIYFTIYDESNYIEYLNNRLYINTQNPILFTKNNKTEFQDIKANEGYFKAIYVQNMTVNTTIDWNTTGNINTTNLTVNDITQTNKLFFTGSDGMEFDTVRPVWAFKFKSGIGLENTGVKFDTNDGTMAVKYLNYTSWSVDINGNMQHGLALLDYNPTITFKGVTNDGSYLWEQSEDYFQFNDDIWLPSAEKILFAATTNYITDNGNAIHISAPNGIIIGDGQTGVDYQIKIDGEDNDGNIIWQEDENQFNITENVEITGNLINKWVYEPQYISISTTKNSASTTSSFNPFANSSYTTGITYDNNSDYGINYNITTGKFEIIKSGSYVIDANINLECAGVSLVLFEIKHNEETEWNSTFTVHSSVDPVYRGNTVIHNLEIYDNISVTIDGVQSCSTHDGTTFNMYKIAN